MVDWKKLTVHSILFLCVVTLLLPSVTAASYSTIFNAVDNEILPNETATFDLTISNFDSAARRFQVYSIDPKWVVKVSPLPVAVDSETSETFRIHVKPKSDVGFGSQGVVINVKDLDSGDIVRQTLLLSIKRFDSTTGVYVASIELNTLLPAEFDPREAIQVMVRMRNRNALDIRDMSLRLSSPHINQEQTITLEPLAENVEYYSFKLDPLESPGQYELLTELYYKDELVSKVRNEYEVLPYTAVEESESRSSSWFKVTHEITLDNSGNAPTTVPVVLESNWFSRLFTSISTEAEYDGGLYSLSVPLGANDSETIVFSTNYRWPIGFVLLVIVAVVLYYLFRSPLVGLKEVVGVAHGQGVSDIKIRIFIKNRSGKAVQGVEIFDKIPSIAELKSSHAVGTVKPDKVSKLKNYTLLKWSLDILEPFEERILTYTIKSKLTIVGKLSLPQAKIRYENKSGQERTILSNNLLFVENK